MNPNEKAGVVYEQIDPFKLLAQKEAAKTAGNFRYTGIQPNERYRGESVYPFRLPGGYGAHVEETLGTKEHLAGMYYELTGDPSGFFRVAQCAIAMIVNDMLTAGIPPSSIQMHLAAGSSDWFESSEIATNILKGWRLGCDLSKAAWTGGETPVLKGTVVPGRAVISGSAFGFLQDPAMPYDDCIKAGHRIIGVSSSGVHANGISFIRQLVEQLRVDQKDVAINLCNQALAPTRIYSDLIHYMRDKDIVPSYALNVTGHGYRKLMRSRKPFVYRIKNMLAPHRVFGMIQDLGKVDQRNMYSDYNMGTGFVFIAQPDKAQSIINCAEHLGYDAIDMGEVEESPDGEKSVILEPVDIIYGGQELNLRH